VSAQPGGGRWWRDVDELPIVLTGGPADGHWYRRDDFTQRQGTARRTATIHHRLTPRPGQLAPAVQAHNPDHQSSPRPDRRRRRGPAGIRNLHDLAHLARTTHGGEADTETVA